MRTPHRELTLRRTERQAPYLVQAVGAFCQMFSGYCFQRGNDNTVQDGPYAEACLVLDTLSSTNAVLTFASPDGVTLSLTSIVPARVPAHSVEVYNEIVERFATCFSKFCSAYDPDLHVELIDAQGAAQPG